MAVLCPNCKKQYDITLFQFGKTVVCECGHTIELDSNLVPSGYSQGIAPDTVLEDGDHPRRKERLFQWIKRVKKLFLFR